jgi:NAD(P)-dependent dehydrogenase (short-subunit alcohol dehydrogenase family)
MGTENKIAFITGANKGLGLETARGLSALGIDVLLASRDEARGKAAAESLAGDAKGRVEAVRFDVNRPADYQMISDHLESRYGRLDILVNNAAISIDGADFGAPNGFNTTLTVTPEILRQTFETNFFAVVALTQALLPLLRKAPAARIVNLSSVLGSLTLHADPNSGIYNHKTFAYDASKTALNAFTVHLAQELKGTKIKVNSAHPGWVKTDMGGESAPLEIAEGGKTSVQLATLGDDGPSGGYFHLGEPLPW